MATTHNLLRLIGKIELLTLQYFKSVVLQLALSSGSKIMYFVLSGLTATAEVSS